MHPGNISISEYLYHLPEEKIPTYPSAQRDHSKLLIYEGERISEDRYYNLAEHIPADSLLVFNNTKVVPARILFTKPTGGVIEIFCLEPGDEYPDISTAMATTAEVSWKCLVGGASKWKHGQVLKKSIGEGDQQIILNAEYVRKEPDHFVIKLSWEPSRLSFAEILHVLGAIPLPPYIKRESDESDMDRYQTIYSKPEGSVAAPTAGLHFTEGIFDTLAKKNIATDFVTLHVGAGTFKPVKSERLNEHLMHSEWIDVSRESVENLVNAKDKLVIAVGTTSLRTLESLYWIGCRIIRTGKLSTIGQWEPYEEYGKNISKEDALAAILKWMNEQNTTRLTTKTSILIAPGYKLRIAGALLTNFHQPGSTLLLLVAAIIGEDWKKVYDYALKNDFRFLSYGDGCLLFNRGQ